MSKNSSAVFFVVEMMDIHEGFSDRVSLAWIPVFARMTDKSSYFPPIFIQVAEQERLAIFAIFNITDLGDGEVAAPGVKRFMGFLELVRRGHGDGKALERG